MRQCRVCLQFPQSETTSTELVAFNNGSSSTEWFELYILLIPVGGFFCAAIMFCLLLKVHLLSVKIQVTLQAFKTTVSIILMFIPEQLEKVCFEFIPKLSF